jgi:NAD(P)-dependent dehydrogenase (short-subunit alcohol dehydrogenase family)
LNVGFETLELDVRSDASVCRCVERVVESAGRVDLLVNNAGIAHSNLMEETRFDLAKSVFEANFFGAVRLTRAVLPTMRRQRSGRIINIGSLAGLTAAPGQAFYSASKFALEGFTEALRFEVESFNIKVCLIEPGFFRTAILQHADPSRKTIADYDGLRGRLLSAIESGIRHGGDPEEVARLIVRVAGQRNPKLRHRVGLDAKWVPVLQRVLPDRLFAVGVRRTFRLA